jgi:predicted Zn-dependent protease
MRRLETETERLRAVSESLERANQKLKDRLAVLESAPAPVAERAPAPSEAIRTPDVPEPERADSLPDEVPPPVKANLEEPSLGTAQKMIEQGQVEAAEALLQTLAAVRRPDVKVLTELGRLQLKQKRYPEAIQTFQAALRREPKNVAVLKDLALACHGGNQLAEAIRYLNKVVQLDDKDGESHFNLAALYLMIPSPKIKESAAHYEKALRLGESRDEKLEKVLFQ